MIQTPDLETCKKLKEAGFNQDTNFYWTKYFYIGERDDTDNDNRIGEADIQWTVGKRINYKEEEFSIAAPLTDELFDLLPSTIDIKGLKIPCYLHVEKHYTGIENGFRIKV